MKNYLVIWKPDHASTVDEMKVIDAFATDGGKVHARKIAKGNEEKYGNQMGRGRIYVVQTSTPLPIF
jgi:hypothetical protein